MSKIVLTTINSRSDWFHKNTFFHFKKNLAKLIRGYLSPEKLMTKHTMKNTIYQDPNYFGLNSLILKNKKINMQGCNNSFKVRGGLIVKRIKIRI